MNQAGNLSRQEFIKRCGQILLASGLTAIGLFLGFRKTNASLAPGGCILKNPCFGCGQFRGCGDPKALAVKAGSGRPEDSSMQETHHE